MSELQFIRKLAYPRCEQSCPRLQCKTSVLPTARPKRFTLKRRKTSGSENAIHFCWLRFSFCLSSLVRCKQTRFLFCSTDQAENGLRGGWPRCIPRSASHLGISRLARSKFSQKETDRITPRDTELQKVGSGHSQQFPKHQVLNELESCVCASFSCSHPVSLPLPVPCCCLLSRVSGMIVDKATVSCPSHSLVRRNWSTKHNVQEVLFSRHWISSPVSVSVSRGVFQVLAQVVGFRCWDRQVEIQVSCSVQISQRFLAACQICKCRRREFVRQTLCHEQKIQCHPSKVL